MNEQQLKDLSLEEMRELMARCKMVSADYHLLRRECQRRLEGWNRIANCSGCVILFLVLLILYARWFA